MKRALPTYQLILMMTLLGLSSCNLINPEEAIPAFVKIDAIDLETDYSIHGTDSHKITEAWVFADGNRLGSFELPAEVPVLESGNTDIQVRAGIKQNGIASTRTVYPFYDGYNTTINLSEGETTIIEPTVGYQDEAVMLLYRDFESTIGFEDKLGNSQIDITVNSDDTFEGSKSMKVRSTTSTPNFQIGTSDLFVLEATSLREAYIEMDYRNTASFEVYIKAIFGSDAVSINVLTITPKEEWNKIYIDFARPIQELNADSYEFGFRSVGLPSDATEATYLWDNIKFIVSTI